MKGTIAVVLGIIVFVGALAWFALWVDGPPCIRDKDAKMVGGQIWRTGGMFSSDTAYGLWYTGQREGTGEHCETLRRVTEAEYDRRMYHVSSGATHE